MTRGCVVTEGSRLLIYNITMQKIWKSSFIHVICNTLVKFMYIAISHAYGFIQHCSYVPILVLCNIMQCCIHALYNHAGWPLPVFADTWSGLPSVCKLCYRVHCIQFMLTYMPFLLHCRPWCWSLQQWFRKFGNQEHVKWVMNTDHRLLYFSLNCIAASCLVNSHI